MCHWAALTGSIAILTNSNLSRPYILFRNVGGILQCTWAPFDGRYVNCRQNEEHQEWATVIYDGHTGQFICGYETIFDYIRGSKGDSWVTCTTLPLADGKWWHIKKECGSWGRGLGEMVVSDSAEPLKPDAAYQWCNNMPQAATH